MCFKDEWMDLIDDIEEAPNHRGLTSDHRRQITAYQLPHLCQASTKFKGEWQFGFMLQVVVRHTCKLLQLIRIAVMLKKPTNIGAFPPGKVRDDAT